MEILELRLQTINLKKAKKFYSQIIGFDIVEESQKHISFKAGKSNLVFELTEEHRNPVYHFAFNIPLNKIDEAIEWMSSRKELILADDKVIIEFESWNARSIYFYDNNQNILEFICRTDLKNLSDQAFSVSSILNISEAGIVTDEPIKLGEEINKKCNTSFFSKGPVREDFAALGDDNGLFVISNPHRNWYPTQDSAEKWKVKVRIRHEAEDFDLEFN